MVSKQKTLNKAFFNLTNHDNCIIIVKRFEKNAQKSIKDSSYYTAMYAPLAKLDIASVYGTEGQGFESLTACHKNTNH